MRNVLLISLLSTVVAMSSLPAFAAPAAAPKPVNISNLIVRKNPPFINNLVSCRLAFFTANQGNQLKAGTMKKFLAGLCGPKHLEALTYDPESDFGIEPVSYAPTAVLPPLSDEDLANAHCMFVCEPKMAMTEKGIALESGTEIIEANKAMTVELPEGRVELEKGAVVKISALNGVYRIVNIVDDGRDSVRIHVCKRHLSLAPGQEARYSINKDLVTQHLHDGCGRRAEKDQSCCTYAIKVNEVSVAAILKHDPIGRQLYLSHDPEDKALANRIVKTAAALALWTKAKTPYSWN